MSIQTSHPMITRNKDGTRKPKVHFSLINVIDPSLTEPHLVKSALKNKNWVTTMEEELLALRENNTWELVPRVPNMNVIGSRWVYKIKSKADGSIERFKARLVAKGYAQVEGLDFEETFSPVIKPTTIRLVVSLAIMFKWPIHQSDVKNAFLHGFLQETVYME